LHLIARYRNLPAVVAALFDARHALLSLVSFRRLARREWAWLAGSWRGTMDGMRDRWGPYPGHPRARRAALAPQVAGKNVRED
jgi:hypothetical protein